ncbi:class A sortase [Solibacillus cecembensis]|uniref:class A sortase n=1 Tax=Solibacillus cecembensis TaxID=459347 RepID=UPI003D02AF58
MKNKLINVVIAICFIIGLVLIFINPIQNFLIAQTSKRVVENQVTVSTVPMPTGEVAVEQPVASYDFEEVQSLTIWDILAAQGQVKDIPAIGSIHIPAVDMTLPILNGVGKYALAVGAGTMKSKQQMGQGNYALASHYIEGKNVLFGPLYHLKKDDSIFISDMEFVYEYKTTSIKVIEATDVHVIDDLKDDTRLTLITCAEDGTRRLSVVAQFVGKTAAEEATQLGMK